jgi:hypothetical protein
MITGHYKQHYNFAALTFICKHFSHSNLIENDVQSVLTFNNKITILFELKLGIQNCSKVKN